MTDVVDAAASLSGFVGAAATRMCFGGGREGASGKTRNESCQSRWSNDIRNRSGRRCYFCRLPSHFPSYVPSLPPSLDPCLASFHLFSSSPTTPNKKSIRSAFDFGPVMFNRLMRLSYCINGACALAWPSSCRGGRTPDLENGEAAQPAAWRILSFRRNHSSNNMLSLSLSLSLPPQSSRYNTYPHDDGIDDDYDDDDAAGSS